MTSLYMLQNDVLTLNAALEAHEGNLDDCPGLREMFDRVAEEQPAKLDALIEYVREKRMRATGARAERDQWAEKERRENAAADAVERRMLAYLTGTGQLNAETASGRVVSVVKNGGALPVVLADSIDPAALEARFVRYKASVNVSAVAEALAAGEVLPFAKLGERGVRLKVS